MIFLNCLLNLNWFKNQTRQNNDNIIVYSHQKVVFPLFYNKQTDFHNRNSRFVVSGLGVMVKSDEQVTY